MFGQVLEKLNSYFGRSFLVARYFPWLLCVAVNLAIASVELPAVRAFMVMQYDDFAANKILNVGLAMLAIWVIAYATAPIVQAITAFLEGGWMPQWVGVFFVAAQANRRETLERKYRSARELRLKVPKPATVNARWANDRAIGAASGRVGSSRAIERAEALIAALRTQRWLNLPALDYFNEAADALSAALRVNCADERLLRPGEDRAWAQRLDDAHTEMRRVLAPYTFDIGEQIEYRARLQRDNEFAKAELAPTRLGNDAAALRSYCETRYGISFDLFWPRFLLAEKSDDSVSDQMANAKIQLDFSILTLTLTTVSTLSWAFEVILSGRSLWTMLIVFVIGPPAIVLWLNIVHASYGSFADVVRSVIDLKRFDVLDALRRPLPVSTDAEKKIWEEFARLSLLNEPSINVTFRHSAK